MICRHILATAFLVCGINGGPLDEHPAQGNHQHAPTADSLPPRSICRTYVTTVLVTIQPGENGTSLVGTSGPEASSASTSILIEGSSSGSYPTTYSSQDAGVESELSSRMGPPRPATVSTTAVASAQSTGQASETRSENKPSLDSLSPHAPVTSELPASGERSEPRGMLGTVSQGSSATLLENSEGSTIYSTYTTGLSITERPVASLSVSNFPVPPTRSPAAVPGLSTIPASRLSAQTSTEGGQTIITSTEQGVSTAAISTSAGSTGTANLNSGGPAAVKPTEASITAPPTGSVGTTASSSTLTKPTMSSVIFSIELSSQEMNDTQKRDIQLWARDQTSGFVGDEHYYNPDTCTNATLFRQGDGQLTSHKRPLSVDPGVDFINISDYPGGSISTSTSLTYFFSVVF